MIVASISAPSATSVHHIVMSRSTVPIVRSTGHERCRKGNEQNFRFFEIVFHPIREIQVYRESDESEIHPAFGGESIFRVQMRSETS